MYRAYSAVMSAMRIVMRRGLPRMGLLSVLRDVDARVEHLLRVGLGSRVCRLLSRLGRSRSM